VATEDCPGSRRERCYQADCSSIQDRDNFQLQTSECIGRRGDCESADLKFLYHLPQRSRLDEARELAWGCQASPIEVYCDNLRLDTLSSYQAESSASRIPLAVIWRPSEEGCLPPLGFPKALCTGSSSWSVSDRFTDPRTFRVDGPADAESVSYIARLSYLFKPSDEEDYGVLGASYVHWVKSGVVISSETLDIPPTAVRLELFLNAEFLETDLSGLHPVLSDQSVQRVSVGVKQCEQGLDGTRRALTEHVDRPSPTSALGMGAFIAVHGLVFALSTKGLSLPFHFHFARSLYRDSVAKKAKVREDCLDHLKQLKRELLKHP
jgi:hypothetical protein